MKVILLETIDSLGIIGSEVEVKDGYARNYLIPQKKAVKATPENRKMMEQKQKKIQLQMAKERKIAEEMAQRLAGITCKITAKVADEDKLYGSVTDRDIAEALAGQGIEVPRRMIVLPSPIKTTGTFDVEIRVYKDISQTIKVEVTAE